MSHRKEKMQTWLGGLGYDLGSLQIASADASFRQYFRINKNGQSYIVMDAPPENESCEPFVALANSLTSHGVHAPEIFEQNLADGFLVLSDFGDDLLLGLLNEKSVDDLYGKAMDALQHIQNTMPCDDLNTYSPELLDKEMDLFKEWFLEKYLGLELSEQQNKLWQQTKESLIKSALEQPQVFVHRDFHSRNLIQTANKEIGIIDFQDAVKGPMTYDVVSLLRDCYVKWPQQNVEKWLLKFYTNSGMLEVSFDQFKHWFNLMGVQRHLKAVGIFSRLKLRDGKAGYVADIPRTFGYIQHVSHTEPKLLDLANLINQLDLNSKTKQLIET